jgi:hypothetical protein
MHNLRLLIIAIAAICILALGVFALVGSYPQAPADDVIIIKGGSLEVQCGKNHGTKCLGSNDNKGKYKNSDPNKHILKIVVKPINANDNAAFLSRDFDNTNQPEIDITYKAMPGK